MSETIVRREYPRAKCIRHDNLYIVVEWDAFFAVGPILGSGYSREDAWMSAGKQITPIDMRKVDEVISKCESYFRKGMRKGKR